MKYLIIGNGVAGTAAAENIRKRDHTGEITILTEEGTPFYSRIRLIEYLAGEANEEDIVIHSKEWYEKNKMELHLDAHVSSIDREAEEAVTAAGEHFSYDRLLLATGGTSFIPPIAGADKKGVFALRTIKDADEIISFAEGKKKIIMIGGGVLGLEAANSLRKSGHDICVVEFFPRLLPRQMDPEGAEVLKAQMENMGCTFFLGAKTKEISGDDQVSGIVLEDGTMIDGSLVIISAGVRAQTGLAGTLGLTVNKGIPVNDRMETEKQGVFAAGDVIEHRDLCYGIWPAAQKQGEVAGTNMAGGDMSYEGTTMSNVLKVAGIDLAVAGDIDADGTCNAVSHKDSSSFIYKKIVIKEHVISGCILYGDITGYRKILKAIEEKKDVSGIMDRLEKWDLGAL